MSDLNGHHNLLKKVSGYFQKFFFAMLVLLRSKVRVRFI